ncbi:MAG: P-loop NTPase [Acidobacteriota bacterium]
MSLILRRSLALALPLAGLGIAALSLALAPPAYRARAVVDLLPLEGVDAVPDPSILRSERARATLRELLSSSASRPDAEPDSGETAEAAVPEERLERFLRRLSWSNVDSTPRYRILFDHPDPQRAMQGANLASRALEELLSPRLAEAPEVRARLKELESEILGLRGKDEDLSLLRQRRAAARQASTALSELYASARTARLDLESRWKALARSTSPLFLDSLDSPLLQALAAERNHLENRYEELSVRFGPRWPAIVELKGQIAAVDERMEAVAADLAEGTLREAEADYRQALAHEREQDRLLKRQHQEIQQLDRLEKQQAARESRLEEKQRERASLLARIEQSSNPESSAHVRIVLPASLPPERHGMSASARFVLGALAGLFLALITQRVLWRLDPPLNSLAAAETILGAPFLASLAEIPGGAPAGPLRLESAPAIGTEGPITPLAEAARGFRDLRTGVLLAQGGDAARVLLVTACRRGEGKSFVASHLALSLAQRGARVLLIDAHLRRPRIHRIFGVAPGPGLIDALAGRVRLEETVRATDRPGLFILPAGDVNGGGHELLDAASLRHLRDRLLQPTRFDHLVIDAGDINSSATPERLVVACAGVLIVVRAGRTLARELRISAATIRRYGISFLAGVWIGGEPSRGRTRQAAPDPVKTSISSPANKPVSTPQAIPARGDVAPSLDGDGQDPSLSPADILDPGVARRLERLRGRPGRERGSA